MGYGAVQKDQSNSDRRNAAAADESDVSAGPVNETSTPSDVGTTGDMDNVAWGRVKQFYQDNIGLFFVFLAQIFASIVSYYVIRRFNHMQYLAMLALCVSCVTD